MWSLCLPESSSAGILKLKQLTFAGEPGQFLDWSTAGMGSNNGAAIEVRELCNYLPSNFYMTMFYKRAV